MPDTTDAEQECTVRCEDCGCLVTVTRDGFRTLCDCDACV